MKLLIEVTDRGEWLAAEVERPNGDLLGSSTAPVVEGATFDMQAAVIRDAMEAALTILSAERV